MKKFDPTREIVAEDWRSLEQALVHSPSSFGLQPWKFFVVTDPDLKEKLKTASWNQSQITDASHLVVFAIKKNLGAADVDRYLARIAEVRSVPLESLDGFKKMLLGSLNRPVEEVNAWATRQLYIALGFFRAPRPCLASTPAPWKASSPSSTTRFWA